MFSPHLVETENLVGVAAYGIALIFLQTSVYTGSTFTAWIRVGIIVVAYPAEIVDRREGQPVGDTDVEVEVTVELVRLVVGMVSVTQVVQVV